MSGSVAVLAAAGGPGVVEIVVRYDQHPELFDDERVAEIGYREVEFAGYFGRSPAEIRSGLEAADLSSPAAHVNMNAVLVDWPNTLDVASTIGHRYLVVPSVPQEMRLTLDHWRATPCAISLRRV